MLSKQRTIAKDISFKSRGLHTGHEIELVLKPAKAGDGIRFIRTDLPERPEIRLGTSAVIAGQDSGRYSALRQGDAIIYTVEHLMSALCGLGIDNITAELSSDEAPGLDGSALGYVKAIKAAGLVDLEAEKEYCDIKEPICVSKNGASVMIVPADEFRVSYTLDYPHPQLASQVATFTLTPETFEKEIAPCRTFCMQEEAETIRAKGLGQGANYDNTLVFGKDGVIKNTLRFPNEPARHKVLDCVGDFYLLGIPIRGHIFAFRSGHVLNRELLKKIEEQKNKYAFKRALHKVEQKAGVGMDVRGIMNVIPHRYPFLLVDRILEIEPGKRAVAIKNVTVNEAFFQGHFPARPVMPGVLMVEAMAQVAGVIVLSNPELRGKLAFFMSVDGVKFRKVIEPGDQVVMEVEIIKARSRVAQAKGTCKVDGQVVCEAEMGFAFGE